MLVDIARVNLHILRVTSYYYIELGAVTLVILHPQRLIHPMNHPVATSTRTLDSSPTTVLASPLHPGPKASVLTGYEWHELGINGDAHTLIKLNLRLFNLFLGPPWWWRDEI